MPSTVYTNKEVPRRSPQQEEGVNVGLLVLKVPHDGTTSRDGVDGVGGGSFRRYSTRSSDSV